MSMNDDLFDRLEDMGAEVEDTLERLMGDKELYIDYLKKLVESQDIVELREAVDAKDYERAMRAVHTLKGVALNLGLLPLVDVCMDMLLEFRSGNNEAAIENIDAVENSFKEFVDAIGN